MLNSSPAVECRALQIPVGGGEIGGLLFIPQHAAPVPLIILSHGLGRNNTSNVEWAERFAAETGAAAFCYDFRGCGPLSSGTFTEMSVMTEAADVNAVLKESLKWDFVDPRRIVLLGRSQGGMASAITAAEHPLEPAALVLLYPAFVIPDDLHRIFLSKDRLPDTYDHHGHVLGRIYALDAWDYDVYSEIGAYEGPVLIIHGTEDKTVPFSYSERAAQVYSNVKLIAVEGAGHGFNEADQNQAFADITAFLTANGILSPDACNDRDR